jgi:hypothetical protein
VQIELVRAGWHRIPLRLEDCAILAARIDDQPARVVADPPNGYVLLYELPAGQSPKTISLQLQYAKAIEKTPGRNRVSLRAPQAPINQWIVHLRQSHVSVTIEPLLAATEVAGPEAQGETVVRAFVGAAEEVRIEWNPRSEGAAGLEALATAEVQQELFLDEGSVRARVRLSYHVRRAELAQLRVLVPADYKVLGVFDTNVRQWEASPAERGQIVTVHLFEPARKQQNVVLDLERFASGMSDSTVTAPSVEALGVGQQQGTLAVHIADTLRTSIERREGLVQVDARDLPAAFANASWQYAFRYATVPYELVLSVEKIMPRVEIHQYAYAYFRPTEVNLDLLAVLDVDRAGLFQIQLDAPQGWQMRSVRGVSGDGIESVAVDSYHNDPMVDNRLTIQLARKAQGRVGLWIEWVKPLEEPDLLAPTGKSVTLPLEMPKVTAAGLEQFRGRLLILGSESLRLTPGTSTGLQTIPLREAAFPIANLRRGDSFAAMPELLAFGYGLPEARLAIDAQRRKPQVHVKQLVSVQVEPGVAHYEVRFFYDVRFSPVKTLRIDVPAAIASRVRNLSAGIRDETITPADLAPDRVAWQFSGDAEFFGPITLVLTWDETLPALEVGKSLTLDVPWLQPQGAERSWGQILVSRSETMDIHPEFLSDGMREIDPRQDLMQEAKTANVARAFEFQDGYQFRLTATRYEPVEVARTSVEAALIRAIVTRSGQLDVQALFRVRTAQQRLAVRFPPGVTSQESFGAEPVRINGRPVVLEQGTGGQYHIPVVGISTDTPFVLELRYSVPGSVSNIGLPEFPDESAISRVYLSVYVPEDRTLVAVRGPWTDEQPLVAGNAIYLAQEGAWYDHDIFRKEIGKDVQLPVDPLERFPVQGNRYLFSTLRPPAGSSGDLRLVTIDSRVFYGALVTVAAVAGLLFLARPLREKLAVIACVWFAGAASAVFLPTLARHALEPNVQLTASSVLGAWLVAEVVKLMASGLAHARNTISRRARQAPPADTDSERPSENESTELAHVSQAVDAWMEQRGGAPGSQEAEVSAPNRAATDTGERPSQPSDPPQAQPDAPQDDSSREGGQL